MGTAGDSFDEAKAIRDAFGLEASGLTELEKGLRSGRVSAYRILNLPDFTGEAATFEASLARVKASLNSMTPSPSPAVRKGLLDLAVKARNTLANPTNRATYDAQLRRNLAGRSSVASVVPPAGAAFPTDASLPDPFGALPALPPASTGLPSAPMIGSRRPKPAPLWRNPAVVAGIAAAFLLLVLASIVLTSPRRKIVQATAAVTAPSAVEAGATSVASAVGSTFGESASLQATPVAPGSGSASTTDSAASSVDPTTAAPAADQAAPVVEKYALFVGVARYREPRMNKPTLEYPEEDAKALSELFTRAGYQTELLVGAAATQRAIRDKLASLPRKGTADGVVVVGLFGHGIESQVSNEDGSEGRTAYFCPHDAQVHELTDSKGRPHFNKDGEPLIEPSPESLVGLQELMFSLRAAGAPSRVVFADCCRTLTNRPRGRAFGANFQTSQLPTGTSVLFACGPDEEAFEHREWKHGAFTRCLIDELESLAETGAVDTGALASRLKKKLPPLVSAVVPRAVQTPQAFLIDTVNLQLAFNIPTPPMDLPPELASVGSGNSAGERREFSDLKIPFRWCPPGKVLLGHRDGDQAPLPKEWPRVEATIDRGFWVAETELTMKVWKEIIGTDPWIADTTQHFKVGPNYPATYVTWDDAIDFCRRFTERERAAGRLPAGWSYRLPHETEWEYACRAGTTTRFWFGDDDADLPRYEWVSANALNVGEEYAHEVGQKTGNPWGLHDLHGNVQEWCDGMYERPEFAAIHEAFPHRNRRALLRGGCWSHPQRLDQSTTRTYNPGDARGLRLVLSPTTAAELASVPTAPTAPGQWPTTGPLREGKAAGERIELTELKVPFRWCPAGTFKMGVPKNDPQAVGPQVDVTLSRGFWLGETEVTQELWTSVMGEPKEYWKQFWKGPDIVKEGPKYPATCVSWHDATDFCRDLTTRERLAGRLPNELAYRLPTEAEWEYACRAGTATRYCCGDDPEDLKRYAWVLEQNVQSKDERYAREVGKKLGNRWGFHDMHGNLQEWCENFWSDRPKGGVDPSGPLTGEGRIVRGGFLGHVQTFHAAWRMGWGPGLRAAGFGFRVAVGPVRVSQPAAQEPPSGQSTSASATTTSSVEVGLRAGERREFSDLKIPFRWCPAGKFVMGFDEKGQPFSHGNRPPVEVTIDQGFWLAETELTMGVWSDVVRTEPWVNETASDIKIGAKYPAVCLAGEETQVLCQRLNERERVAGRLPAGWSYRVPKDSEWEYACRAGSTTRYWFGDDEADLVRYDWVAANTLDAGERFAHEVGLKEGNPWGLRDMHGNVREVCYACYAGPPSDAQRAGTLPPSKHLTARGGGWPFPGRAARSSERTATEAVFISGVRLALSPTTEIEAPAAPTPSSSQWPTTGTLAEGRSAGEQALLTELKVPFRWCPPGRFRMGSPADDPDAKPTERPQVDVTLSRGYWMGETEVTQQLWTSVMGTSREHWNEARDAKEGPAYPATSVSWEDAKEFCSELTAREQLAGRLPKELAYRLPTEAEWEYACRAGAATRFFFGDDARDLEAYAWGAKNAATPNSRFLLENLAVYEVGGKRGNPWGLHDMYGNATEWCEDAWHTSPQGGVDPRSDGPGFNRVLRGGSYSADTYRSASRIQSDPMKRGGIGYGFRLAVSPPFPPQPEVRSSRNDKAMSSKTR